MFLETEQGDGYPATVKIVEEDSSLVVHISLKATWGKSASPDLCGFYDEFGRIMKQASLKTQTKQPVPSSQKLPEGEKESSSPPPPPPASPSPSPSPSSPPAPSSSPAPSTPSHSPSTTPKTSQPPLPQAKVTWAYVNLREGPGIHHKIIGKANTNTTFEILDQNPNWLQVRLQNGTMGWMSKGAASEIAKATVSQSPPAFAHDSSKKKPPSKPSGPM